MTDLSTKYMGMRLASPIVAASSGLTKSVEGVVRCAEAGAGAVVLKSIFEEQIIAGVSDLMEKSEDSFWHPEAADYIIQYGMENEVDRTLALIRDAKAKTKIPIIASVHCVTPGTWVEFAGRIEKAGADALELNVFVLPSDPRRDGRANERVHFEILEAVKSRVSIPVSLKIGRFFSGFAGTVRELADRGADGLVLFNRYAGMDIDTEKMTVVRAAPMSEPGEIAETLRWVGILSGAVPCDIAASTGVHDGSAAVKALLAGAAAVQVCTALYRNGVGYIETMLREMEAWMGRRGFSTVEDFRGKLRPCEGGNAAAYERVQFMKSSVEA